MHHTGCVKTTEDIHRQPVPVAVGFGFGYQTDGRTNVATWQGALLLPPSALLWNNLEQTADDAGEPGAPKRPATPSPPLAPSLLGSLVNL